MGNTKKTDSDSLKPQQPLPVARDYVAEVQQRAQQLAASEQASRAQRSEAGRQTREVQEQMARLRTEAVHARRLAEQIETVSIQHKPSLEIQLMADSSKPDHGREQRPERRSASAPRAGGGRLSFNPLHPSMELPPEQLIRLLSLETKKTRNSDARHAQSAGHKPTRQAVPHDADVMPVKPPAQPIRAQRSRAAVAQSQSRKRRNSWLLPAITVGVLVGLGASGYIFWKHPAPVAGQENRANAVRETPASPPGAGLPTLPAGIQNRGQAPARDTVHKAGVSGSTSSEEKPVQQDKKPLAAIDHTDDPAWQAAAEAERLRLHAEAEQRFAERLRQITAAPASDAEPADVAETADLSSVHSEPGTNLSQAEVTPDAAAAAEASSNADDPAGSALKEPRMMVSEPSAAEAAAMPTESPQPGQEPELSAANEDGPAASASTPAALEPEQPAIDTDTSKLDSTPAETAAHHDDAPSEHPPATTGAGELF